MTFADFEKQLLSGGESGSPFMELLKLDGATLKITNSETPMVEIETKPSKRDSSDEDGFD